MPYAVYIVVDEVEKQFRLVGVQKLHICIIKGEQMSQKQNSCRTASRLRWTLEEEMILKDIYEEKGITSWISIASFLNKRSSSTERTAKQCRERYNNFVRLNQQPEKRNWTSEDDLHLFKLYLEKGSKWADIAKMLPGKSQNHVKNRFYGILRRTLNAVKNINSKADKKDKPLKYQTLIKILEKKDWDPECEQKVSIEKIQFCEKLREDIIQIMKNVDIMIASEAINLCQRARRFNILTRMENMARNRHYRARENKGNLPSAKKVKDQSCRIFGHETGNCVDKNNQRQFSKEYEQNEVSSINQKFEQKQAVQESLFRITSEESYNKNQIYLEYCQIYETSE